MNEILLNKMIYYVLVDFVKINLLYTVKYLKSLKHNIYPFDTSIKLYFLKLIHKLSLQIFQLIF